MIQFSSRSAHIQSPAEATYRRSLGFYLFAFLAAMIFLFEPTIAMAQNNAAQIFSEGGAGENQNVVTALYSIVWWVYVIFKIIALIVVGWSMLEIRNGELTKGFFGILAAVGLFFTPALVDLAKNMGRAASNG